MLDRDLAKRVLQGRYELGRELGRGAWAIVFAATDSDGEPVAVKLLPRAFVSDPTVRQRFELEAKVTIGLRHPHIVSVRESIVEDGLCMLVMELLDGGTLAAHPECRGIENLSRSGAVALAVAAALEHAHNGGYVHRDVKPENILFTDDAIPKLSDFGLARVTDAAQRMTMTGLIVGTPAYLAPELVLGEKASAASDQYSLGVLLYEMLSGQLPIPEHSDPRIHLMRLLRDESRPIRELVPTLPVAVADVIDRSVRRLPDARFPDCRTFAALLRASIDDTLGPDWLEHSGIALLERRSQTARPRPAAAGTPDPRVDEPDEGPTPMLMAAEVAAEIVAAPSGGGGSSGVARPESADGSDGRGRGLAEPTRPVVSLRVHGLGEFSLTGEAAQIARYRGDFRGQPVDISLLTGVTEEGRRRFSTWATWLVGVRHPSLVPIIHAGFDRDGLPFLVHPVSDHEALETYAHRMALDEYTSVAIIAVAADAVAALHAVGCPHGALRLAAIGVALAPGGATLDIVVRDIGVGISVEVLREGALGGASPLRTSAPEIVRGEPPCLGSDVYALGAILFQLLSGAPPFGSSRQPMAVTVREVLTETAPAVGGGVSTHVAAIVARCLQKEPAERFANAGDLRDALVVALGALGAKRAEPQPTAERAGETAVQQSPPPVGLGDLTVPLDDGGG